MGMVLTLIVVVDEDGADDAMRRRPAGLARAPGAGPRRDPRRRPRPGRSVDAQVGTGDGWSGETALIRLRGRGGQARRVGGAAAAAARLSRGRSGGRPTRPTDPAADPLGALAQRRITDAAAVTRGKQQGDAPSVRGVPPGQHRPGLDPAHAVAGAPRGRARPAPVEGHRRSVTAERISPSADLLVAWLADRLKVRVERKGSKRTRHHRGPARDQQGPIVISRRDGRLATFSSPDRPDRPVALQAPRASRAARRGAAAARRGRRVRRHRPQAR